MRSRRRSQSGACDARIWADRGHPIHGRLPYPSHQATLRQRHTYPAEGGSSGEATLLLCALSFFFSFLCFFFFFFFFSFLLFL